MNTFYIQVSDPLKYDMDLHTICMYLQMHCLYIGIALVAITQKYTQG